MKILLFIPFVVLLAFASCKKDVAIATSKKDILTGGSSKTWLTSSVILTVNGVSAEIAEACDKDNTVTFKSDGTYTTDEGKLKCNSFSPQTSSGTYTISSDETTFTESGNVAKIVELASSKFVLSMTTTIGNTSATTIGTLVHQ